MQLAKQVIAGASELVDVHGKAELYRSRMTPKSLTESKKLIFGKASATEHRSMPARRLLPPSQINKYIYIHVYIVYIYIYSF